MFFNLIEISIFLSNFGKRRLRTFILLKLLPTSFSELWGVAINKVILQNRFYHQNIFRKIVITRDFFKKKNSGSHFKRKCISLLSNQCLNNFELTIKY